jgi:hypothetical protein
MRRQQNRARLSADDKITPIILRALKKYLKRGGPVLLVICVMCVICGLAMQVIALYIKPAGSRSPIYYSSPGLYHAQLTISASRARSGYQSTL